MGIESDQLVFDYLSRVGDLAQQQQLPSGTRMRLVNELRGEIERRRAKATTPDSPAAVRRILARLGTPDEVVEAAGTGTAHQAAKPTAPPHGAAAASGPPAAPAAPVAPASRTSRTSDASGTVAGSDDGTVADPAQHPKDARPGQGAGDARAPWSKVLRGKPSLRKVPRPRPGGATPNAQPDSRSTQPPAAQAPSPPHLASTGELGDPSAQPDWWRIDSAPLGGMEIAPGFTGGVEIPEILRPPAPREETTGMGPGTGAPADPAAAGAEGGAAPAAPRPRGLRRLLRRRTAPQADAVAPASRARLSWNNPLLLLAAAALVAGAVLSSWLALAFGWVIAYASRRLTAAEVKWAVMVLPGLAVTAGIVWLWGREHHRWGADLAQEHMSDAIAQTWPWVVRGAALASAAFLVWRSQRRRS